MASTVDVNRIQYSTGILDRLEQMRRDRWHCSFIIKVGSEEIQAHRNMLCAASDYFGAMLSHDTKENRSGVVEMIDVDPECVKICVDHIYGREVSVPPEKYEELMYVADLMQLQMLCDGIIALLEKNLGLKSFFMARRIAHLHGCKNLEGKCLEFAKKNIFFIVEEDEFGELDESFITKLIKSTRMGMSEEMRLDIFLRWGKFDPERSKFLLGMLKSLNCEEISVEKLRRLMEDDPLISENLQLYKIFSASAMNIMKAKAGKEIACRSSQSDVEAAIVIFDQRSRHLQRCDQKRGTWTQMQAINDKSKIAVSAIAVGDHIYALVPNKSLFRLNHSDESATWERMSETNEYHGPWPACTTLSGFIFVVGGSQSRISSSVEKYDPRTNEWTSLTDKPLRTAESGILSTHGYIYCFGGTDQHQVCTKSVQRFHLDSCTWAELPQMCVERNRCGATALNGKIYVLGGKHSGRILASVERYDPTTNQWVMIQRMISSRRGFGCFPIDGCIYAVGGNARKSSIEKYDVEKGVWEMMKQQMTLTILGSVLINIRKPAVTRECC